MRYDIISLTKYMLHFDMKNVHFFIHGTLQSSEDEFTTVFRNIDLP